MPKNNKMICGTKPRFASPMRLGQLPAFSNNSAVGEYCYFQSVLIQGGLYGMNGTQYEQGWPINSGPVPSVNAPRNIDHLNPQGTDQSSNNGTRFDFPVTSVPYESTNDSSVSFQSRMERLGFSPADSSISGPYGNSNQEKPSLELTLYTRSDERRLPPHGTDEVKTSSDYPNRYLAGHDVGSRQSPLSLSHRNEDVCGPSRSLLADFGLDSVNLKNYYELAGDALNESPGETAVNGPLGKDNVQPDNSTKNSGRDFRGTFLTAYSSVYDLSYSETESTPDKSPTFPSPISSEENIITNIGDIPVSPIPPDIENSFYWSETENNLNVSDYIEVEDVEKMDSGKLLEKLSQSERLQKEVSRQHRLKIAEGSRPPDPAWIQELDNSRRKLVERVEKQASNEVVKKTKRSYDGTNIKTVAVFKKPRKSFDEMDRASLPPKKRNFDKFEQPVSSTTAVVAVPSASGSDNSLSQFALTLENFERDNARSWLKFLQTCCKGIPLTESELKNFADVARLVFPNPDVIIQLKIATYIKLWKQYIDANKILFPRPHILTRLKLLTGMLHLNVPPEDQWKELSNQKCYSSFGRQNTSPEEKLIGEKDKASTQVKSSTPSSQRSQFKGRNRKGLKRD